MNGQASLRSATGWSFLTGLVAQFWQVAVSLLLAAILGPERFGVVALATLFVLLMDFLVRQGIAQAIVQRGDLRPAHTDAGFVMVTATGVASAVLMFGLAPVLASLFDAPTLTGLLRTLAGVGILRALWQVPVALAERDLDFRSRAFALNLGVSIGGVVGVGAALLGAQEYALAWQLYTQGALTVLLVYRASDWRPGWTFDPTAARELLSFSSGALLASLGAFVSQRVDTIVIGLFFGPLSVGIYRFASRFVQLITHVTAGALGRVGLASLARVQADSGAFADQTVRLMRVSSVVTAPMLALVLVGARVTAELFGEEWEPAIPVMRILAVAGIARVIVIYTNPIQQARGAAHRSAGALWFASAVGIGAVAIAGVLLGDASTQSQVNGIAIARLLSQAVIVTPVFLFLDAAVAATGWALLVQAVVVGGASTALAAAVVFTMCPEVREIAGAASARLART